MRNIKRNFKLLFYNFKNRSRKIHLGKNVHCNSKTNLKGCNKIYSGVQIQNSQVGYGTYIANDCNLLNAIIGNYCSIGNNSRIIFGQHPTETFVSTHPAFYSINMQAGFTHVKENKFEEHKFATKEGKSVIIGNDVWIGQNVMIMEGVSIADGSIIGSGAIVTKSTMPYSINVGIPAKVIKFRFNEEIRDFLIDFKWWDKGENWIQNNKELFEDVELFYAKNFKKNS